MAPQVHREVVHEDGEIGAVVRVEPPHEVLRRLTASLVLRDDDAREVVQHLQGRGVPLQLELARRDLLRRSRRKRLPGLDNDLLQALTMLVRRGRLLDPPDPGEGQDDGGEANPGPSCAGCSGQTTTAPVRISIASVAR